MSDVPVVLGLEFPKISQILVWPDLFPSFNKVALIAVLATLITAIVFYIAGSGNPLEAPKGVKNIAESTVAFIQNGIILQTMGPAGLAWTPLLLCYFCFIYLCNLPEVIPFFQMPATARMAIPAVLGLLTWVLFNVTGMKHQGVGHYWKSVLFPPGVPKPLYLLVTPIEFLSTIIVRPFSLAVRLLGNMMAGHILLVTFAVLAHALFTAKTSQPFLVPMGILPFIMLILMTGFELLVGFLQAFIFTILTAVYIGGAMNPEH